MTFLYLSPSTKENRVKRLLTALLAISISIFGFTNAEAATKVQGGPLNNIETGQTVHLSLSDFPSTFGLYILQCQQSSDAQRPTLCNQASQLWVSTAMGATFAPTADILFKPTATFVANGTSVDCTKVTCGIFLRADHTASSNTSEDQFIPITFKAASDSGAVLPADVITAKVNGMPLSPRAPYQVKYRESFLIDASSAAGSQLTFTSMTTTCVVKGNKVTALKGAGFCDIAISSKGGASYSASTAHFPLQLMPAEQTISSIGKLKRGKSVKLPKVTNMGEKISYTEKSPKICSVAKGSLTAKRAGSCVLEVHAAGLADTYLELHTKITVKSS